MRSGALTVVLLIGLAGPARAGLYYSGETFAELPSQWRGFLLDQRALRGAALKATDTTAASPLRKRYEEAAAKLAAIRDRALTADEAADLGALSIRLGDVGKALEVLKPAVREHPGHFRLAANLGTAWQLTGDFDQAAAWLRQAVKLAPGRLQKAEELHLKLVQSRARQKKGVQDLDDLFGVRYLADGEKYEPGKLGEAQRKALPEDAVARTQQLALWLPSDSRLLWQLAELAAAHGDAATAAAMMDGCVTEFGLRHADLLAHRRACRTAADDPDRKPDHEKHALQFKPRSSRPLAAALDRSALPPIDPKGVNALPWTVVVETKLDREYRPTFPDYLKELDGKEVSLQGFMQPITDEATVAAFLLIEYPVGCWYCEMPDLTGMILVELPDGREIARGRSQLEVTGKLKLNDKDPENFLYVLRDAKVKKAE